MLKLKLISKDNPILNTVALEVRYWTYWKAEIAQMFEIMETNNGIGLAANQVGILERIIVIHANGFRAAIINPVIVKPYGGKTALKGGEGCLSFPGMLKTVIRHKQVLVTGYDENWKEVKYNLKGLAAIVAQHEIDHLNGITIEEV